MSHFLTFGQLIDHIGPKDIAVCVACEETDVIGFKVEKNKDGLVWESSLKKVIVRDQLMTSTWVII